MEGISQLKRVIQLVIEADGDYCGKCEVSPICNYYEGHSGMIRFHHNCLAYLQGLVSESYTDETGRLCTRIKRCAQCLAMDQGEAMTEMLEKIEGATAVQKLRIKEKYG
jgi:hypothetical protein